MNVFLMEAGCKEKKWKYDNEGLAYEYQWAAQNGSKLLAKGVCIERGYQKHFVPEKGITKVHCTIEKQKLRAVDAKKQTVSIDFTLTLRWLDPHIRTQEDHLQKEGIVLSPEAIDMIWTPDMHIWNRASFDNEWKAMISSKILSPEERNELDEKERMINQLDGRNGSETPHTKTGIEMRYEIKTTVFCEFQHDDYPMDEQTCNITYGSGSLSAIFGLYHERNDSQNQYHRTADFDVSISFFDQNTSHGNNTVGIKIEMDRITTSFVLKYYIPCIAIVFVSIMGFIIPVSATLDAGRVALLVTLFLTLINLFIYHMVI